MAKYFTYYEFIKSDTANRLRIDNTPTSSKIQNNIIEVMRVMDKIREAWTKYCKENFLGSAAIIVNSGYRCEALNKAINGSKTSAHKIGSACDFEALNGRNKELFKITKKTLLDNNIPFDQLLDEFNWSWIHLGLKNLQGLQRRQIKSIK